MSLSAFPDRDRSCELAAGSVFLNGCQVRQHWRAQQHFTVLELNLHDAGPLLATLASLCQANDGPRRLDYVALLHPRHTVDLLRDRLRALGLADTPFASPLLAGWPLGASGLHGIDLDTQTGLPPGCRARVTLAIGNPIALLRKLRLVADAVFFDGSELATAGTQVALRSWLGALPRLMAPGARLTTTIARRDVQALDQVLQQGGFETEPTTQQAQPASHAEVSTGHCALDSPPAERMAEPPVCIVARMAAHRQPSLAWPRPIVPEKREVVVIGAGLAGCATAAVLAERGWSVTVLDESTSLMGVGGSQPRVADHPHFSADDNLMARLTRHALWLGARWRPAHLPIGRLQMAANPAEWLNQVKWCASAAIHSSLARCVDAQTASALVGLPVPRGGLWIPACDALDPVALCHHWLNTSPAIVWRSGIRVARLWREADRWHLSDASAGQTLTCPVVILANAGGAQALAGLRWPALQRSRGQSTRVAAPQWQGLRSVLGGSVYACPLGGGELLVGATADGASALNDDPEADRRNLGRLQAMLGASAASGGEEHAECATRRRTGGVGWRFGAPDHLPLIGHLPDEALIARHQADFARNDRLALPTLPGLYGHFGLGSRGLLWSILGAEVLASMIDGGPAPLEADLLQAIAPTRFVRQRLRRQLPL